MRATRAGRGLAAALGLVLVGCTGVPTQAGRGGLRGRSRAAERALVAAGRAALERAETRATRCFQGEEGRVTVDGVFTPHDGRFTVRQTGNLEARRGLDQCVAAALETAQIEPFAGPPLRMRWTAAGTVVSAAVRAMMAERHRVTPETYVEEADWRAVFAVLVAGRGAFQDCYEDALRRDPTLTGTVTLRFTLTPLGRVRDGRATGTRGLVGVGHCVLSRVFLMGFPPPVGGVSDFEAPLRFRPR